MSGPYQSKARFPWGVARSLSLLDAQVDTALMVRTFRVNQNNRHLSARYTGHDTSISSAGQELLRWWLRSRLA